MNEKKTKIVHFRKKNTRRSNFLFKCCDKNIGAIDNYYSGMLLESMVIKNTKC